MPPARCSACIAVSETYDVVFQEPAQQIPTVYGLAIVVTTANLFTAGLDATGEIQVTPVDRFEVLTQHTGTDLHPVLILNESALRKFVVDLLPAFKHA